MSASTQQGPTTQLPIPGNGHKAPRKARGPNKKKAAAKTPAAPLSQGAQPGIPMAQTNVAARRIGGPVPLPTVTATTLPAPAGSLAWLYARQQEIEIEGRVIRGMIASFGPRKLATTGTVRTTKKKKAKRRAPMQKAA